MVVPQVIQFSIHLRQLDCEHFKFLFVRPRIQAVGRVIEDAVDLVYPADYAGAASVQPLLATALAAVLSDLRGIQHGRLLLSGLGVYQFSELSNPFSSNISASGS